jgi:phosphate acetyltransferase
VGYLERCDEDITLMLQHFGLKQTYEASFGLRSHQMNPLIGQHKIDQAIATL